MNRRLTLAIAALVMCAGVGAAQGRSDFSRMVPKPLGMKYEKSFPLGRPWPVDLSRATIELDNSLVQAWDNYFKNWRPTPDDVRRTLARYRVIAFSEWGGMRSHVGGNDRGGRITLADGTRLKWMLRPGGLGVVVYPDGGAVYLDGCCLKQE
jgi:hypothetical protein